MLHKMQPEKWHIDSQLFGYAKTHNKNALGSKNFF